MALNDFEEKSVRKGVFLLQKMVFYREFSDRNFS